jgi:hypothetical protein
MNIKNNQEDTKDKFLNLMNILLGILFMNAVSLFGCQWLGCYEISLANLLRANLACNMCTDVSYNLYKHQMEIYVGMGGIFLKIFSNRINNSIQSMKN